jgi:hypothetical protein
MILIRNNIPKARPIFDRACIGSMGDQHDVLLRNVPFWSRCGVYGSKRMKHRDPLENVRFE